MNIGKPRVRKQNISFLSAKDGYLFLCVHLDENRLSEVKNRSLLILDFSFCISSDGISF